MTNEQTIILHYEEAETRIKNLHSADSDKTKCIKCDDTYPCETVKAFDGEYPYSILKRNSD